MRGDVGRRRAEQLASARAAPLVCLQLLCSNSSQISARKPLLENKRPHMVVFAKPRVLRHMSDTCSGGTPEAGRARCTQCHYRWLSYGYTYVHVTSVHAYASTVRSADAHAPQLQPSPSCSCARGDSTTSCRAARKHPRRTSRVPAAAMQYYSRRPYLYP